MRTLDEDVVRQHLNTLVAIEKSYREYRTGDVSEDDVDRYHGILGSLWLNGLDLPGGLDIPNEKRKVLGSRPHLGGAGMTHRGPLVSLRAARGADREVFLDAVGRAIECIRSVLSERDDGAEGEGAER